MKGNIWKKCSKVMCFFALTVVLFTKPQSAEAYETITVDGDFSDWDEVNKTKIKTNDSYNRWGAISEMACLFDGEYVYIYIRDGLGWASAAGAGIQSNGKYAITTDLGRTLIFQLTAQGDILGTENTEVKYYKGEWEIAIPTEELPAWRESISLGTYLSKPIITNITNLQGTTGTAGEINGIVYDGQYGDWTPYPHTLIHYFTGANVPDAEGAVSVEDGKLYGHVETGLPAHLMSGGGDFAYGISVTFNGKRGYNGEKTWNLYPRLVSVAEDGTINWYPQTMNLPEGQHEFYIADARGEYSTWWTKNISDLKDYEQFFGRMTITINGEKDEMEYYIDLEQVAKFLSHYRRWDVEAEDFKLVEVNYSRLGNQWLSAAGTSSGPVIGALICCAIAAAGAYIWNKRKEGKVA